MPRVAAVQLSTEIGNPDANIASCERLAMEAVKAGASWIALPEFFNTGVAWLPALVDCIEPEDGAAGEFLRHFSARHEVVLGGSFLCRLPDGRVRNRYLCYHRGDLVGRHDKDLPTMWENAFYEGGEPDDTGELGTAEGIRVGSAVCWEFLRTATARRLRGRVDVIMGGSFWWSIPTNWPSWVYRRWEPANNQNSLATVQDTARLIGAPVLHASHCGELDCPMPGLPLRYRGYLEGNAAIIDAYGHVLASRTSAEGEGIVVADTELAAVAQHAPIPQNFWLRRRGLLPTFAWHQQRWHGRRWYEQHVKQAPTARPVTP